MTAGSSFHSSFTIEHSTFEVVFLSSLRLRNFRNFADQALELPPEGVALVGDNGQGKTNLLEAIYYLEIFRSFRGAADEQLVRFGEDVFRIEARVESPESGGASHTVAAALDRRAKRKKITVDGAEPPRLSDAIGTLGAVIFSPSDVEIVSGSPGARRRFLDIVLSLALPGHLALLQRYRQALGQRNALLRQGAPRPLVESWDAGLIGAGSRIIAARRRWVEERAATFAARSATIAGGAPSALAYDPSVPLDDIDGDSDAAVERIAERFAAELSRVAEREQRRGMTMVGPHRDDLRLTASAEGRSAPIDLRTYGSGGQQRTAAVALRMVEAETLQAARGREPIILLDDVFAELDAGRSRRILEWVEAEEGGQVILTAPKPSDFELRGGSLAEWRIDAGIIQPYPG
jgi:DNA replication and repair protein RecF